MVSHGLSNSLHSFQPAMLQKPLTIIQAISMENIVLETEVFQEKTQGILVARAVPLPKEQHLGSEKKRSLSQ